MSRGRAHRRSQAISLPMRRPCRPCGSRSPTRCRTRTGSSTKLPSITLVWSRWKIEECGSWLKSIETLRLVGVAEDALQRAVGGRLDRVVDLFLRGRALGDELEVDDRDVRRRHADRRSRRACPSVPAAPGRRPWRHRSRSGSSTAPRRGRGRDPCASCRASAGRRCRSGSSSSCPSRCRSRRCSTLATGARQLVVQEAFEIDHVILRQLVVVDAVDDGEVGAVGRGRDDDALGAGRRDGPPPCRAR